MHPQEAKPVKFPPAPLHVAMIAHIALASTGAVRAPGTEVSQAGCVKHGVLYNQHSQLSNTIPTTELPSFLFYTPIENRVALPDGASHPKGALIHKIFVINRVVDCSKN